MREKKEIWIFFCVFVCVVRLRVCLFVRERERVGRERRKRKRREKKKREGRERREKKEEEREIIIINKNIIFFKFHKKYHIF